MYIPYFLHVYRFICMRYALQPTHITAYAFLACQFQPISCICIQVVCVRTLTVCIQDVCITAHKIRVRAFIVYFNYSPQTCLCIHIALQTCLCIYVILPSYVCIRVVWPTSYTHASMLCTHIMCVYSCRPHYVCTHVMQPTLCACTHVVSYPTSPGRNVISIIALTNDTSSDNLAESFLSVYHEHTCIRGLPVTDTCIHFINSSIINDRKSAG